MLFRAATQAYKQAIISECRSWWFEGHLRCLKTARRRWRLSKSSLPCCACVELKGLPTSCPLYTLPAADGTRAGMTAEGVNAARTAGKQLTLQEAQMILGVESGATWQEIMKVRHAAWRSLVAGLPRRVRASAAVTSGCTPGHGLLPRSCAPQKYDHLFQANEKNGSFYLQSKVYRCVPGVEEGMGGWSGRRARCSSRTVAVRLHDLRLPSAWLLRAKERLEQEFQEQGMPMDQPEGQQQQQQQQSGGRE